MLWETSDLERPLSPTRRSRHSFGHLQRPVDNGVQSRKTHSPDRPIRRNLAQANKPAAAQQTQRQRPPSDGTPTVTMHYLGLAQGELGVLSKRQALPRRPATAPAQEKQQDQQTSNPPPTETTSRSMLSKSCQTAPWRPLYSLDQQHRPHTAGSSPARDIRLVVDDPDGRRHALHDVFSGRPLQPARPCSVTASCSPKRPSTTRVNAAMSGYGLPVHERPRLLSAGGFPGWKLSKSSNPASPGHAPDPRVPKAFSQITCPSNTCHSASWHSTTPIPQTCTALGPPAMVTDNDEHGQPVIPTWASHDITPSVFAATNQQSGSPDGQQTAAFPEDGSNAVLCNSTSSQWAAKSEFQGEAEACTESLGLDETSLAQEVDVQYMEPGDEVLDDNLASEVNQGLREETLVGNEDAAANIMSGGSLQECH